MVDDVLVSLATHLRGSGALRAARDHYKLEEWLAVSATAWWRSQSGWDVSGAVVPYVTARAAAKWCDVYARRRDGRGTSLHLLAEFKAVPAGAAAGPRTLTAFARDVRALADCDAAATRRCWRAGVNPTTGRREPAWFGRVPWFPAAADQGRLAGAAVLLLALPDAAFLDVIADRIEREVAGRARPVVRDPVLVPAESQERPALGCLAYAVQIAESRS